MTASRVSHVARFCLLWICIVIFNDIEPVLEQRWWDEKLQGHRCEGSLGARDAEARGTGSHNKPAAVFDKMMTDPTRYATDIFDCEIQSACRQLEG